MSEEALPVGWPAAFLVLGGVTGLAVSGVSAVAPSLHHHGSALEGAGHAALFALPPALLLAVVLRLPERPVFVAAGLTLVGSIAGALL